MSDKIKEVIHKHGRFVWNTETHTISVFPNNKKPFDVSFDYYGEASATWQKAFMRRKTKSKIKYPIAYFESIKKSIDKDGGISYYEKRYPLDGLI